MAVGVDVGEMTEQGEREQPASSAGEGDGFAELSSSARAVPTSAERTRNAGSSRSPRATSVALAAPADIVCVCSSNSRRRRHARATRPGAVPIQQAVERRGVAVGVECRLAMSMHDGGVHRWVRDPERCGRCTHVRSSSPRLERRPSVSPNTPRIVVSARSGRMSARLSIAVRHSNRSPGERSSAGSCSTCWRTRSGSAQPCRRDRFNRGPLVARRA